METVLTFANITKQYPGVVALKNISISFEAGQVHALLGENGAGKSTLIKLLSGAILPEEGSITIFGEEYSQLSPRLSQNLGIGVIHQELNLVPQLSIAENIFLGHEKTRGLFVDMDAMNEQAERLLADLGIEMDPATAVKDLSVAYMQLVEIAKAVSTHVRILVFDEPTAPLTSNEVDALFLLINKLRKKGVTMLYISHRMEEIFEISDTVTVLRDGALIKKMQTRDADRSALIDLMVGRQLIEKYPEKDYSVCDEVLSLSGLSSDKVHDISFSVCKGEILGIAGLVGAGRTELARLIFGADPKRSGTVRVDGVAVDIASPKDAIRCGIALVPEDRKQQGLFLELAVRYNMSLPSIKALAAFLLINRFAEKTKVAEYIRNLQIRTPSDTVQIKNLSGGNQQKAVIAKWLATDSKVLIFDEPTRGIDVGAKQEIYRLMHELASRGLGIIMISSEMPELIGMADRLLVMRNGTIVGELSREETTQNAILQLAAGYNKETV